MSAPFAPPLNAPGPEAQLQVLREVFGYREFRLQQGDVIAHASGGGSALVLMPTGGGKSLCYQVPAIARHRAGLGVTLVVSPLIALMHDQVEALREAGVAAAGLTSALDGDAARQIERDWVSGRLTLLYAAPERVTQPRFLAMLDALQGRGQLSLIAIDEAHCVSQWGHDFREHYLQLSLLHERYPAVPRLALTATADQHTRQDIVQRLDLQDARLFISSFDRPNIFYTVVDKDKPRQQLLDFLRSQPIGDSGIVYCQSRKSVEQVAAFLVQEGFDALPYHAGLDAAVRQTHQNRFLREDAVIMVATIAFGMGIDKPDVRFVAHLDLPRSIESYYQETGRAGRDGAPARAWMCVGAGDVMQQRRMIEASPADDTFKRLQGRKLDALLALTEAHDCRRVHLLDYFGEASRPCGHCDNCVSPPQTWDATRATQQALSTVYRLARHGENGFAPTAFGATHLIDVLQGKASEKVREYGHERLSTFGIGKDIDAMQWRQVVRHALARHLLRAEGDWGALALDDGARPVLRGEQAVHLRVLEPRRAVRSPTFKQERSRRASTLDTSDWSSGDIARWDALRAWRSEVARQHDVPVYVIFNNASLADMAQRNPSSLDELADVQGVGAKKLQAYGEELITLLGRVR
ncbi:DNA helicase RecQ [Amphibiibacter pelophylacis]|uniref:DNA helicase RecQ n=1 Tax=Amphibiibacter pelophylacis TaxID=1799477 RepID=A0ACC6P5I1_9BURK